MNQIMAFGLGGAAILARAAAYALWRESCAPAHTVLIPPDRDLVALGQLIYSENYEFYNRANLGSQPNWRSHGQDCQLPVLPYYATGHTWHIDEDTLFHLTKCGTGALMGHFDHVFNMRIYVGLPTDDLIIAILNYTRSTCQKQIREVYNKMENENEADYSGTRGCTNVGNSRSGSFES